MIVVCDIDDTLIPLFTCFRPNKALKQKLSYDEYRKLFPKHWNDLRHISLMYFNLESWISFVSFYIKFHVEDNDIQHIYIISKVAPRFELLQTFKSLFNQEFHKADIAFMNEDQFYDELNQLDPTKLIWVDDSPSRIGSAIEYGVNDILLIRQPWNERLLVDSPLTPLTLVDYITDSKALADNLEYCVNKLCR